jgi:hypothetical protein
MRVSFGVGMVLAFLVGQTPSRPESLMPERLSSDPVQLINHRSVQKDLKLTPLQREELHKGFLKVMQQVLNSEQTARIEQIGLQVRGPAAFGETEIHESLRLSDEQKAKVKAILEDGTKRMREALEKDIKGKGARDAAGLRRVLMGKLVKVLNYDQRKRWQELVGPEFQIERPAAVKGETSKDQQKDK